MSSGRHTVYGRRHAARLLWHLMQRPARAHRFHDQSAPVLVCEGTRDSGKTSLVGALSELLNQRVPYARVDLEKDGHADVPQVLSALAFGLGQRCPIYGRILFPRLVIGLLVMRIDLPADDRVEASRQVVQDLKQRRGITNLEAVLRQWAGDLTRVMLPAAVPTGMPGQLLTWLIDGLSSWAATRRVLLGSALEWYGEKGGGDAIDRLVELNRWARMAGERDDSARRRDELLWAAFRADLLAAFRRGTRGASWVPSCVVLLDDADTDVGQRLLEIAVRARRDTASDSGIEPLAIVATSRGSLLKDLNVQDKAEVADETTDRIAFRDDVDGNRRPWWRYRLSDVALDDLVHKMAPGQDRCLLRAIHQLTGGHPGSTRRLVNVIEKVERWPAERSELEELVRRRPAEGEFTIEETLVRRLLGISERDEFPDHEVETLITCSAARKADDASVLFREGRLTVAPAVYERALTSDLWIAGGPACTTLRRLLLRRLADRSAGGGHPDWATVHGWLRESCGERGDGPGRLHHALAAATEDQDLEPITAHIDERLDHEEVASWLELVRAVTVAPTRLLTHRPRAVDEMHVHTHRWARHRGHRFWAVARLLVGLWIAADPFSRSDRAALHTQIADEYRQIARLSDGSPRELLREAEKHVRLARDWACQPHAGAAE